MMVWYPDAPHRYKDIHDLLLNVTESRILTCFRLNKMWLFSLILSLMDQNSDVIALKQEEIQEICLADSTNKIILHLTTDQFTSAW